MNIEERLSRIAEWYEKESGMGRRHGWGRIVKIAAYLEETGLDLDEVELQVHQDELWSSRENRKPHEKAAMLIGQTALKGQPPQKWWVVPKAPG